MATAGYSATPQARKLGLNPGVRLGLVATPDGWSLTEPPDGLVDAPGSSPADVVLAFVRSAADLRSGIAALGERVRPSGAVWVLWPRKAAGHVSDVDEFLVRECVLPLGMVDTKVAAVDEDWSGLKVVWRLTHR